MLERSLLCAPCGVLQFAKVNQAIRVTPAMEAGISDNIWSMEEIVSLMDERVKMAA